METDGYSGWYFPPLVGELEGVVGGFMLLLHEVRLCRSIAEVSYGDDIA